MRTMNGTRYAALAAALLLLGASQAAGARAPSRIYHPAPTPSGTIPSLNAKAAMVIDAATGSILLAKNPDLAIPPASLTKLLTLHIVYEEIAAGRLSKDELVTIDKRDCSPYIPYGSSLMYLRPGMKVSILDLMRGAAVVSGNDAAFALARRISGSNEAFARRMNAEVSAMGFTHMFFVESSGLSELNFVTAREFALFCRRYLELHPESISELHSLHYIEFPRPEHQTTDFKPAGRIIQYNRNDLVLGYEGCDGLKTGYIIESGYNLAATAMRGGTRFILVTLGGNGEGSPWGGAQQRSRDGAVLLDWCFGNFVTMEPGVPPIPPPRTWFGVRSRIELVPASRLAVTLTKAQAPGLALRLEVPASIDAPVSKGQRIGEALYSSGGVVLRRVDLVAAEDLPRGNFLVVIRDSIAKFFAVLFGRA
jgi:D-alanyl-D-alanine carboxypeptidase (penicillin-binding protein 5/6)